MPKTARLTNKADNQLSEIKESYDIDVNTSKVVELAIESLYNKKVNDES